MKTLREIPAVRALAEEQARGRWTLRCARRDCYPAWDPTFSACEDAIEVELDLLCNLDCPASRDALRSRVLTACDIPHDQGTHLGRYTCGEHCCDGDTGRMVPCSRPVWSLMGNDGIDPVIFADCPDPDEWDGDERRHVPGISAVTDPAEALRLIAIAVLGGSRG